MKILCLFIVAVPTCIKLVHSNKLFPLNRTICAFGLAFPYITHTIILDLDDMSDPDLTTCLLKELSPKHCTHLIKGRNVTHIRLPRLSTTTSPNIIMITRKLSNNVLMYPSTRSALKNHFSLVYIIVSDKNMYKCENGKMNATVFTEIDNVMNNFWFAYKIARIVIAFPFACKDSFVFFNEKRLSGVELYERSIKLITVSNAEELSHAVTNSGFRLSEEYPLRANIFYRFPTSVTECSSLQYYVNDFDLILSQGYCGLDGLVMHDIVKYFKFKLSFPRDKDCHKYGYADTRKVAGSLGCIVREELDISFNSRFVRMYSSDYVIFLHYITTDSVCALTTQTDTVPLWHYVYNILRVEIWLLLFIVLIVVGTTKWIISKVRRKITNEVFKPLLVYISESIFSFIFGYSFSRRGNYFILRGTCLLCSIFFVSMYQSHVNHVFTTMIRYEAIRTLEELYETGQILYTSPTMRDMLKQMMHPLNSLEQQFINTSHLLPGNRIDYILRHPNTVTLGRKIDTMLEILLSYTDENGVPLINIVDECYGSYYLSYIARAGFPFVEHLQLFIERLKEAGLPKMYYMWTRRALGLPDAAIAARSEARPYASITLADQRIPLAILLIGYLVSIIALVIEMWRGNTRITRKQIKNR